MTWRRPPSRHEGGQRGRAHTILCATLAAGLGGTLALTPGNALAHSTDGHPPGDLTAAWSFDPLVVVPIVVAALTYTIGVQNLWERAGRGRGVRRWQAGCFAAGIGALIIALISPLDALSGTLFSVHMVQHLLLILVAAPLLMLGEPLIVFSWALPAPVRPRLRSVRRIPVLSQVGGALARPGIAWATFALTFWLWHVPFAYDAAVHRSSVHAVEHVTLLAAAFVFWSMLRRLAGSRRLEWGTASLLMVGTMLQQSMLAALLTFSNVAWYPHYRALGGSSGIAPLRDQELAGLVMWLPANLIYLLIVAWLILRWLGEDERRSMPHRVELAPAPH